MVQIHPPAEQFLEVARNATGNDTSRITGNPRLSELRGQWGGRDGFDSAAVAAVEQGHVALLPVGNVVTVKPQ